MSAHTIIEHFDPFKNILLGVVPCRVPPMMHKFRFQRLEEIFHGGIVPTVGAPTHARHEAVGGTNRTVRRIGVLRATVGAMQHAGRWCATAN
jgi:hypothetical protein